MAASPRMVAASDTSLLVTFSDHNDADTLARVHALTASLLADPPAWLLDAHPTLHAVLLEFDTDLVTHDDVKQRVLAQPWVAARVQPRCHDVMVRYDGPDLAEVCSALQLKRDDLIEAHTRPLYTVGFFGFQPGFAYLVGVDDRLAAVPRREHPRAHVAAGSVGIAAGHTAIYPNAGPAGWQLIGHAEGEFPKGRLDSRSARGASERSSRPTPVEGKQLPSVASPSTWALGDRVRFHRNEPSA